MDYLFIAVLVFLFGIIFESAKVKALKKETKNLQDIYVKDFANWQGLNDELKSEIIGCNLILKKYEDEFGKDRVNEMLKEVESKIKYKGD